MSNTKEIVLARAHAIHFFRPLFTRGSAALIVLAAALYLIGRFVWVGKVFENMPHTLNMMAVLRFFEAAFLNTAFGVQVLVVVALAASIWLAREVARSVVPFVRYA